MIESFRISFSLKNTYRVNGILYSLQQIPLIRRLFPDKLYSCRGLKRFAAVIAVLWEIISLFLGKLIYLAMVFGLCRLYSGERTPQIFLHILFFHRRVYEHLSVQSHER